MYFFSCLYEGDTTEMEGTDPLLQSTRGDSKRQEFYERLYGIHEEQGTPLRRPPMVSGNVVDLYEFRQKVLDLGGYKKLTEGRKWTSTARMMYPDLPYNQMLRAGYLLRNYYLKLLMPFDDMCGPDSNKKKQKQVAMGTPLGLSDRSVFPHSLVPTIPSSMKPAFLPTPTTGSTPLQDLPGLRKEGPEPTGLNLHKILRALEGGFPNEVDFVFNILLMISSDDTIEIQKEPKLLELMTAHVGVLPDDMLLMQLHRLWYDQVEMNLADFWREMTPHRVHQQLLPGLEDLKEDSNALFHSEFKLGTRLCVETYRVSQVLTILLNFSFSSELLSYLARNTEVLKLLVLSSYCSSPELSVVAVDTLGNIAAEIELNYLDRYLVGIQLIKAIETCIMSCDCHMIIRGLEILEGLATTEGNISFITDLSSHVYRKILDMLLLGDLQLLSGSLECLVALSHYEITSAILMEFTDAIGIFMSLITFHSSSLDDGALQDLIIYKTLNDAFSSPVKSVPSSSNQMGGAGVKRGVVQSPVTDTTTVTAVTKNLTQLNPELIATSWLKTCYEEAVGERVYWTEMCRLYNGYCTKLGKIGTMNTTGFLTLAKKMFPTAVLTKANVGRNQVAVVMTGLRKRSPLTNPVLLLSQEVLKMPQTSDLTSHTTPLTRLPASSHITHITPSQLSQMTPSRPSHVAPSQLSHITPSQLSRITPSQLSYTAPSQPSQLSPVALLQPSQLTPLQPSQLAPSQTSQSVTSLIPLTAPAEPSPMSPAVPSPFSPSLTSSLTPVTLPSLQTSSTQGISTVAMVTGFPQTRVQPIATAPGNLSPLRPKGVVCKPNVMKMSDGIASQPVHIASHHTTIASSQHPLGSAVSVAINEPHASTVPESLFTLSTPIRSQNDKNEKKFQKEDINHFPKRNTFNDIDTSTSEGSSECGGLSTAKGMKPVYTTMNGDATSEEVAQFTSLQSRQHIPMRKAAEVVLGEEEGHPQEVEEQVVVDVVGMDTSPPASTELPGHTQPSVCSDKEMKCRKLDSEHPNMVTIKIATDDDAMVDPDDSQKDSDEMVKKERRKFLQSAEGKDWLRRYPDQKVCLWEDCCTVLRGGGTLESHLYSQHLNHLKEGSTEFCKWAGCQDRVSRRWTSLLLHLKENHVSTDSSLKKSVPDPQEILSRLRAVEPLKTEERDVLTNSIQMSTALILRNLARNSLQARSLLSSHSSELAEIISNKSEVSAIVAECIYYVTHGNKEVM